MRRRGAEALPAVPDDAAGAQGSKALGNAAEPCLEIARGDAMAVQEPGGLRVDPKVSAITRGGRDGSAQCQKKPPCDTTMCAERARIDRSSAATI